ncbi:MAG: DUF3108 domain-containing protein [Bacteroidia bacterium]
MKTCIKLLTVFFTFISAFVFGSEPRNPPKKADTNTLNKVNNFAFTYGEKLEYRMHYGPFNAGYATLEILPNPVIINGRKTYNIKCSARSSRTIDIMVNKVRNDYESFLDEEFLVPYKYTKSVEEGKFRDSDFAMFDHDKNTISAKKGSVQNTPINVQDLVSVYYWTRLWDVTDAKVGDTYPCNFYMDGKVYNYNIKYLGKEVIKTDEGTFNAIKVRPQVKTGDFFRSEDSLTIWVSDDENHIVLKAESEVFIGSVALTLTGYKNLKNPLKSKIK